MSHDSFGIKGAILWRLLLLRQQLIFFSNGVVFFGKNAVEIRRGMRGWKWGACRSVQHRFHAGYSNIFSQLAHQKTAS